MLYIESGYRFSLLGCNVAAVHIKEYFRLSARPYICITIILPQFQNLILERRVKCGSISQFISETQISQTSSYTVEREPQRNFNFPSTNKQLKMRTRLIWYRTIITCTSMIHQTIITPQLIAYTGQNLGEWIRYTKEILKRQRRKETKKIPSQQTTLTAHNTCMR
jgi:hypothetical protein